MYHRHTKPSKSKASENQLLNENFTAHRREDATPGDQEEQYTLLFEQHPDPMWVFDRETLRFLAVNNAAIRLYGFSREEFLAMTLLDIRPPEYISRLLAELASTDRLDAFKLVSPPGEWKHHKKDGSLFDAEVYCSRTTFNGREARVCVAKDVSERKRAERALQVNEQIIQRQFSELQTIYQQAPIGLSFLDRDLRFVRINEQMAAMDGAPAAEHVGRHLRDILPTLADVLEPMLQKIIETGVAVENVEIHGRTAQAPDVEHYWLASYNPVINAEGKVLGITTAVMETTESKQAEQALRENRERLGAALLASETGTFRWCFKTNFVFSDGNLDQLFGLPQGTGKRKLEEFLPPIHPDDRQSVAAQWERCMTQGTDFDMEYRVVWPDKTVHWLSDKGKVFLDAQGKPLYMTGACVDITAHKQAQEQLESRLQQQAAVAQLGQAALAGGDEQALMNEAMMLVTQALKIELVRVLELLPGGEHMLLRAGVGWKPGTVDHVLVPTGNESQAGHTLASGKPVIADDLPEEKRFKIVDLLQEYHVQSSITVIIKGSDDDRPYGVLGACSTQLRKFSPDDVAFLQTVANVLAAAIQRKRFEEQLGRSEQRFRELADSMPQIIWAARPDGYLDYYNKRWFDYSGLTCEESLAPDGWKAVFTPEDYEECRKGWYASVKSGEPFQAEYRFKNGKTGEYRWHLIKSVPVRDEQGHIVRWFGSSTDIDEQKRVTVALEEAQGKLRHYTDDLEKRVQERTAHLQESLQSLEDVLYHVAHDLRAPLRAMEGLTTLLLEEYAPQFDAEGKDFAGRIVASAGRMDSLIRDLLAFGRLGHVNVPCRQVDLGKLLRSALELLQGEIRAKSAIIRIQTPLSAVWANETLLEQVLVNLLSNALKYVPAGVTPALDIWSEVKGDALRLSIQDNGIGIEPEHHQRVFRVFERLHPPEDYPGTGIGLAIVAKSLERMGGRVGLESKLEAGSRFWIELPQPPRRLAIEKQD
jgi:PAS domain S-box-containing protein